MPITRDFGKPFGVQDFTQELVAIPNQFTLLAQSGLFQTESVTTHGVLFEEQSEKIVLLKDMERGTKPQATDQPIRKVHSYAIPHFPYFDQIGVEDIQGKRAYGSQDSAEQENALMLRKLTTARKAMSLTLEIARWQALNSGTVYAPNGTVVANYYTDFGVSKTVVNFDFATASSEILDKCEQVVASIQDNQLDGGVATEVIGYCSPGFFSALIKHPKVTAAYSQYAASTPALEILRNRAGAGGPGVIQGRNRTFEFGGIRFIEVRESIAGVSFVNTNTAIFVPVGIEDAFVTYFSPAHRKSLANTLGEEAYAFVFPDGKDVADEIEGETNFINLLRRPKLVVGGTIA